MSKLFKIGIALLLLLAACRSEKLPPGVFLPDSLENRTTGDTMTFSFSASDDELLEANGYVIKPAFDSIPGILPSWRQQQIYPANANTTFEEASLIIPDSVSAGTYRLTVFAKDNIGLTDSLSDGFFIDSKVDTLPPAADTIIAPDTLMAGDDLAVHFAISDDIRLVYADYRLTNEVNDSLLLQDSRHLMDTTYSDSLRLPDIGAFQRVRFEVIFYDWVNNNNSTATDIVIKE